MGKKRTSSGHVSQGIHTSSIKTSVRTPATRIINQRDAWEKGKNVVLTIENPNKNETNKKFIRVNAWDIWGNPRKKS